MKWLKNVLSSGTLSDKVAAHTLLVQVCGGWTHLARWTWHSASPAGVSSSLSGLTGLAVGAGVKGRWCWEGHEGTPRKEKRNPCHQ